MPLNNLIKKIKFKDFGFATITSSGYIEETVGLIGNLKKIYPKLNFYICTIDNISKSFLVQLITYIHFMEKKFGGRSIGLI